ncbi:uncharacterized protein LOC105690137 isoform X4 [Athalia rosae]|uniref:uncharacterized protein LOC105690137 isoform X4 n=1 Tax=Athalia rosae TaxID=37344 RepID=UPI0020337E8B|nr:uncharacterized protein LOC105690137 isoform X4 [Athalia rosae]
MLEFGFTFLLLGVGIVLGRPSEQPIKFDLSPARDAVGSVSDGTFSKLQQGQAASEAQNNVASVIAAKGDLIAQGRSALETFPKTGFFNILPPITRETVHLESSKNQALLEKPVMGPVAGFIESILRPTPLVDKIKESDKYGNSGERFAGIGKAIVDGYEGFSNFLNTVVDFPVDAAKKTSRKITETLNQFGAHLVGLA